MLADYKAIGKDISDITFGGEYAYMTADLMISMMKKVAPELRQVGVDGLERILVQASEGRRSIHVAHRL